MVNSNLKNSNLVYRKLKISDYSEFKRLFYSCFNKKISFDFFKWRYFGDNSSFCYGIFKSSRLIANVGMFSVKLNNKKQEKIFSRHSSMVLSKYRGSGVFSDLLKKVKKKILKKVNLIVMWPNKKNFANFGIENKKIIKKKFFLYKTLNSKVLKKKTKNYKIDELQKYENLIKNTNSLFLKNFKYFNNRYMSYQKHEYFINKYESKKFKSFFILKRNNEKYGSNYVVLDHFGSKKIKLKHHSYLIRELNKLVFLSKKKIINPNFKFVDYLYFKIGFIKKFNLKKKKFFNSKEIFLGDTDIFINIEKI